MNEFDKKLYKTLSYFANHKLSDIMKAQKTKKKEFSDNVNRDVQDYAFGEKCLDADVRRNYGITPKGLDQLRILEGIIHNQKTFWISITAITLSILSLIIGFFVRGG